MAAILPVKHHFKELFPHITPLSWECQMIGGCRGYTSLVPWPKVISEEHQYSETLFVNQLIHLFWLFVKTILPL